MVRNWGKRLLKQLGRLGILLLMGLVLTFVGTNIVTIPGLNAAEFPEVPPVDLATIETAKATEVGGLLAAQGFSPAHVISDEGLIGFLDEQEKKDGVSSPGPYVVFTAGQPKVANAEAGTRPDVVVDANNNVMAAVVQEYTGERGTACYNNDSVQSLMAAWTLIHPYVDGKSLPMLVPVGRNEVPQLPSGFKKTNCYVYPTS